jgi:superfamily II DNA/RNA helicase
MFDFPLNSVDYIHRAGRCGRAGRKGIVTALVTKRDKVLSDAIQGAIARGLPIDNLTSAKRDYQDKGKLASVVGRAKGPSKKTKALRERVSVVRRGAGRGGERVSKYASKAEEKSKDDAAKNKGASALAASTFNKQSSPLLGTKSRGGGGSKLSQSFPKKRLR